MDKQIKNDPTGDYTETEESSIPILTVLSKEDFRAIIKEEMNALQEHPKVPEND